MNQELSRIFDGFMGQMQAEPGILGAWNFGSAMHGLSDEYSDVDIVFLVEKNSFEKTEQRVPVLLAALCDQVLLCWEEEFNSECMVNNGYLLKKGEQVFQFDVFLLNQAHLDDFMCRIHYTNLQGKDVVWDPYGEVHKLCRNSPQGQYWDSDLNRLCRTYWYHVHMSAKYLRRRDSFKLRGVMQTLFETHQSLLLTAYDQIRWGGPANKSAFLPKEKQEHLKRYGCSVDFFQNREQLWQSIHWFLQDFEEICGRKGTDCDSITANTVCVYWEDCVSKM